MNPTVFTPAEIAQKATAGNHSVKTVLAEDKFLLLGGSRELAAITGRKSRPKTSHEQVRA